jgi:hypothetical protein
MIAMIAPRHTERLPRHVGEDLNAAGAEIFDRTVDLDESRIDVVHRQGRDERREPVRVFAAYLGQRIVGDACQLRRLVGRRHELQRRISERQQLLEIVELIEQPETRIDIHDGLQPRKGRHGGLIRNEERQAIEIRLRHEMIEHIDDHARSTFLRFSCEADALIGDVRRRDRMEAFVSACDAQNQVVAVFRSDDL